MKVEIFCAYCLFSWIYFFVGVLVIMTLSLSVYLLFEHLTSYKNPEEQKFLIGVILMVPCYAVESFVSLVKPTYSVYCEILRDCYEAFAMYCFGRYLIACLGGEERAIEFMEKCEHVCSVAPLLENSTHKGTIKHPFPLNYFIKPWKLGQWFYQLIKIGVVQYMIIKSVCAILAVILEAFDLYCEGDFKWNCGYSYIAVVLNFSQSWALYCLVQFYTATKQELAHIKPLAKFLTFKSIVFLTWWQGVAIALLADFGILKSTFADRSHLKSEVQDFIICIEMWVASLVHIIIFPAKPYKLMGDRFYGSVSILGDYVSAEVPLDPEEVRDSERPTRLCIPVPERDGRGTRLRDSVCDVVMGGGEFIIKDVKFTVTHAVEPVEKGIMKFNQRFHGKRRGGTNDDSCINSTRENMRVSGIDDLLLNGSMSDSGKVYPGRKPQRFRGGYRGRGESSSSEGYQISGHRWVIRECNQ